MSTPIQPGDRIAVTATWLITANETMDSAQAAIEAWSEAPAGTLAWLPLGQRRPVQVSARPVHDVVQAVTGEPPAAPVDPSPPDLFFGPKLAAEALRRIAEADRAHALMLSPVDVASITTDDGWEVGRGYAAWHAEHMRGTAAALMKAADIAARLAPDFSDEAAWTWALSAVEALSPPPAEEQVDEALVEAVETGAAAAWQQRHDTAGSSETEDGAR